MNRLALIVEERHWGLQVQFIDLDIHNARPLADPEAVGCLQFDIQWKSCEGFARLFALEFESMSWGWRKYLGIQGRHHLHALRQEHLRAFARRYFLRMSRKEMERILTKAEFQAEEDWLDEANAELDRERERYDTRTESFGKSRSR